MIKFPDFSLTFPDILREHKWSIVPRNSSDIKMHLFLSATLIYTDIYIWQLHSPGSHANKYPIERKYSTSNEQFWDTFPWQFLDC